MNGKKSRNLTIFGGTGDLAYRKLIPAFYNLFVRGKINKEDRILVIGRRDYTNQNYIDIINDWTQKYSRLDYKKETFDEFVKLIEYYKMDFTNLESYNKLSKFFCDNPYNENIFYYAVAPRFFDVISDGILKMNCLGECKIVIEKPFGETLEDANNLNKKLETSFGKENIYRIDHYLGKEMVRNILTVRFKNQIFKNSWDKNSIDNIKIIASEEVGVETRAGYYDKAGALKDMVQNHIMQILSIVALEEPDDENDLKSRQLEVFKSLRGVENISAKESLVLAQYEGYLNEDGVNKESKTETFAFLKLFIDNERWENVPFYLMTGKKLSKREMLVKIVFKPVGEIDESDELIFYVQPVEGVNLKFNIKKAGDSDEVIREEMDFCQNCILANRINTPEAYERLIDAVLIGDNTWFSQWEQIYLSWKYIEELKEKFKKEKLEILSYKEKSTGPKLEITMM